MASENAARTAGRRPALLLGLAGMAVSWLAMVGYFLVAVPLSPALRDSGVPNVALGILGVVVSYIGWRRARRGGGRPGIVLHASLVSAVLAAGFLSAYVFWWSYRIPPTPDAVAVGDRPPALRLPDTEGREVSLEDHRGRWVVVIFFRGPWCPFCLSELWGLAPHVEAFERAGAAVLAISSSPVEMHRDTAETFGLGYPLLADPTGSAIRAWGLEHPGALPFHDDVISRPATYIVDPEGVVRFRYLPETWRVRMRPEEILSELETLARERGAGRAADRGIGP